MKSGSGEPDSGDTSWIDRVADASNRKKGKGLLEKIKVEFVEKYESGLGYLGAISAALKNGQSVSVWEFLDAAIMATNETHPIATDGYVALRQFQNGEITHEQCSVIVSKSLAELEARSDAVYCVQTNLAGEIGSLEGLVDGCGIQIDKSKSSLIGENSLQYDVSQSSFDPFCVVKTISP